ncbi:MBL fold metallo-hydrolase [Mycobacterium bourgelatii]|uniref:MBL fold hydrolase n=1 Tax=Mycobacterium bourgelatii TaxID=1273442 RepID=A0A7I9YSX2_MYCBU|nr:MBL fold metallo-hydrolase [Mycobacterium bourgelatii]MCV6977510.1 MBL fold metallo-hydrolase [Mycobacterium bourgelatii]GFG91657.1 MBL fold hydrolase [Mycobacterium bourgelatii]
MIFEQHYLTCLSQASYLVGDESTGRAVVVDPRRDVGVYLEQAAQLGLRIERVIETHIHADFLSGHLELAAATGAVICYGEAAEVEYPIEPLRDGQRISLGEVTFEILATPGHTPESISVVVYEHPDDEVPYGVLTGDTLFVGDVGRPDLLVGAGISADNLARRLYQSLHGKLLKLPDTTRVFPAHGAGSACGKNLSSETCSTIGEQRRSNYAANITDVDAFVASLTSDQAVQPRYFEYDARRNRQQRQLLNGKPPDLLAIDEVWTHAQAGANLLDSRGPADFAAGHLRGAVNVSLDGRFAEWAGAVLDYDRDIVLVGDPAQALEARVRLARVGLDRVVGQLDDLATVFAVRPELVQHTRRHTADQLGQLHESTPDLQLVDVRGKGEVGDGTIPGAHHIPLPALADSLAQLDRAAPVVAYCASGTRSMIAASLLQASGFADVADLSGGFGAWQGHQS